MFSRSLGLCALLLAALLSVPMWVHAQRPAAAVAAGQGKRPDVAPGEYFVGFRAGVAHDEGIAAVRDLGAQVTTHFPEVRAAAIRVAGDAAAQAIARNPHVAYVEPMPMRYAQGLDDSQLAPSLGNGLYGLITTRATDAHALGVSGAGINIGVADTGIDYAHPDIAPNYRGGIDTFSPDNDPIWEMFWDEDWDWWVVETHGTHVAGTILAANNSVGVLGVAPSANLYHARVISAYGGTAENVMDGVRWLVQTAQCKIMNLSIGGDVSSITEQNFYQEMRNQGVLLVCAAGNYGTSIIYPAAYPSTMAVGALDVNNQHWQYSNTGDGLDVSAPGIAILSSVPAGQGFSDAWVQTTQTFFANALGESGITQGITRPIINCGLGKTGEFPPSAAGNIALIGRGDITFMEKVTNAMNAGAVAVIIYNNVAGNFEAYLDPGNWIPAISVTDTDGAILVSQAGTTGTVVRRYSSWASDYGTSMATPHVTGVLALVWSVHPLASSFGVENALFNTCVDLGAAGYDTTFGRGLANAQAAVAMAQSASPPALAPTGLVATGGQWQVSLSWNASAGADAYIVKRARASGGPYEALRQVNGTSFVDSRLISGTTFYYTVAANNLGGVGPNSNVASATTTGSPPPAGSGFQSVIGPPNGAFYWARPYALSGDSSTVVGYGPSQAVQEAFRWTSAGGLQGLGDLAGGTFESIAYGVSGNGSVIVGYSNSASGTEAFRWTGAAGMQGLGDLAGGVFDSTAYGVSGDGTITVGYGTSSQGRQAIRHTLAGGMQGLGDLNGGAFESVAHGISSDGTTIVGYATSSQGKQAFRWTSGGGMQGLGDLAGGAFESVAYAVSADGSVVVGSATSAAGKEAFRWTSSGGMRGLGDLSGGNFNSSALAVSSDGSIVLGMGSGGSPAFVWTASAGMQNLRDVLAYDYNLDLTDWSLYDARGISADSRTIMGYGFKRYEFGGMWFATLGSGSPCATFVAPDLDHDCDVDSDDVSALRACSARANVPAAPQCATADFDGDHDVDGDDFGIAQRCYRGSNVMPDPSCATALP